MRFRTLAGILTALVAIALLLGQVAAQRQVHKSTQVTIAAVASGLRIAAVASA